MTTDKKSAPPNVLRHILVVVAVLLVGTLVGLLMIPAPSASKHDSSDEEGPHAPLGELVDFRLTGSKGIFNLSKLRSKLVLVYFGYTSCPDICPTSLAATAAGLSKLTPAELEQVEMVFVSLDPERDTQPRLGEYASFFHPKIQGLTGSPDEVAKAAALFGVIYRQVRPAGASDYVIDHSALTYVVGPDGRLVAELPHAAPSTQVVEVVRQHLPASR